MTSHSHYPPDLDADSVTSSPRSDHFHDAPPRIRFMHEQHNSQVPAPERGSGRVDLGHHGRGRGEHDGRVRPRRTQSEPAIGAAPALPLPRRRRLPRQQHQLAPKRLSQARKLVPRRFKRRRFGPRTRPPLSLFYDPGSPAPVVSSPYCSTSSAPPVPSLPNLPYVKTKPLNLNPVPDTDSKENQTEPETEPHPNLNLNQNPNMYSNNPVVHYPPEAAYSAHSVNPVPVYYVSGPVRPGSVPVPMQTPYHYVQQPYHAVVPPQVPIGYHPLVPGSGQVYGAGVRHMTPLQPYSPSTTPVVHDGLKQHVYHAVPNSGPVPVHPVIPMTGLDEPQRGGA
ncbi:hypothetical protein glysoja_028623 [Glycine soja]|uniref:Uncharacterized protein n=1 Tax=Glycine soja TaxID=3848 RepID=A0A0B2NSN6_GLYSO|nr:hypothetical protein glysoja_028623 [Glycine soja]